MTEALNQRILSDVIAAIRHALCLPDTPISAASRFTEDLGLDSLDLVELTIELEETFEIELPSDAHGRYRWLDSLDLVEVGMELEARFQVELPDDFGQRCRSVAQIAGYLSQRYFQDAPEAELECEPADFALAA